MTQLLELANQIIVERIKERECNINRFIFHLILRQYGVARFCDYLFNYYPAYFYSGARNTDFQRQYHVQ